MEKKSTTLFKFYSRFCLISNIICRGGVTWGLFGCGCASQFLKPSQSYTWCSKKLTNDDLFIYLIEQNVQIFITVLCFFIPYFAVAVCQHNLQINEACIGGYQITHIP